MRLEHSFMQLSSFGLNGHKETAAIDPIALFAYFKLVIGIRAYSSLSLRIFFQSILAEAVQPSFKFSTSAGVLALHNAYGQMYVQTGKQALITIISRHPWVEPSRLELGRRTGGAVFVWCPGARAKVNATRSGDAGPDRRRPPSFPRYRGSRSSRVPPGRPPQLDAAAAAAAVRTTAAIPRQGRRHTGAVENREPEDHGTGHVDQAAGMLGPSFTADDLSYWRLQLLPARVPIRATAHS